jgi:hypothetical protein
VENVTDAIAFSPFAIGLYQAYKGAKEQDLFREYKATRKSYYTSTVSSRASLDAVGPYMTAVQQSNHMLRSRQLNDARGMWNQFAKGNNFFDLEAAKRGIAEVMTNPNFRNQLAGRDLSYNQVMGDIGGIGSGKDLWNYFDSEIKPHFSSVGGLEDEMVRAIGGRAFLNKTTGRGEYAGQMIKMLHQEGADFSKAQHILKEGQVSHLKGYSAAQRLFQVAKQGVAGTVGDLEYFKMPSGGGKWSHYARLTTRTMKSVNIPLDHNRFQFAPGIESSIYHLGGRGNTLAAPPGMMMDLGSVNNRLSILPGEGGSPFTRWEQRIFWQEDSILEGLLKEGGPANLERALSMSDPDAAGTAGVMKYFQTIDSNLSGATVALGRSSTAVLSVQGAKDLQELTRSLGLSHSGLMSQMEAMLNDEGYSLRAGVSPGQIPGVPNKPGSMDVLGGNISRGIWDVYTHPELTSDMRRPKQGWSAPWIMQNQRELISKRRIMLDNNEIYNPVRSPMLNTDLYDKMSRGSMSAYVQPSIIVANSSVLSDVFGLEEGHALVDKEVAHPSYYAHSKKHRLARATQDMNQVDYNPKLKEFLSLAEIADTRERRRAIHQLQRKQGIQFEAGELLGQRMAENRGLTEEFLKLGGSGDIVLRDITTDEKGYKLDFTRVQPLGVTDKGFMGAKVTLKGATGAQIRSRSGESSFFTHVMPAKELIKPYNDLLLRNQQITGLKYSLFEPESPYLSKARGTGFQRFLTSDNVLDRVGSLGSTMFNRMGLGGVGMATETAASTKMLLGTVATAFGAYKRFGMSSEDLGKIFHLEKRILSEALKGEGNPYNLISLLSSDKFNTALGGGAKAEDFREALLKGIGSSRWARGDIPNLYRDSGSAYLDSRPRIERRAFDFLMSSHGFPDTAYGNLGKMMLGNVSANLVLDDPQSFNALQGFAKASRKPGKGANVVGFGDRPLHQAGTEMLAGAGGYIDPSARLGEAYGPLYMPDKIQMRNMAGLIDVGGDMGPITQSYESSVRQFLESLKGVESGRPEAIALAQRHWGAVKKQELALQQRGIEKYWRGSLGHSMYETVQRLDTRTPNMIAGIGGEYKYTFMGEGLGVASNKRTIEELAERAIERAGTQAEIDEIKRQRDLVLEPTIPEGRGARYMAPMHVSRNPNLIEHSHQMMGLYYDPDLDSIDGRIFRFGKRMSGDMDLSPGLAMSSAFDADGDKTINAWLSGEHSSAAFKAINDRNFRDIVNRWNDDAIMRRNAIAKRLKDTISAQGVLKKTSRFVEAAGSHVGQAQIGMLSYRLNEFQMAAEMSKSVGKLTDSQHRTFAALFEAMEQEAIGFKHVLGGKTIAEGLSEDIQRIMGAESLEESKEFMTNMFDKYFGEDFMKRGIDYGGDSPLRVTEQAVDALMPGIQYLKSDEMKAVTALARAKSEDAMNRSIERTLQMLSPEKELDSMAVTRIVAANFREEISGDWVGRARNIVGDHIKQYNEAQKATRSALLGKPGKAIGLGLAGTAVLYSMFDKGYSNKPLEVPGAPSTSMAMRMSIADGSILRDSFMGRSQQAMQGGPPMPAPPGGQSAPYVPNSIPNRSAFVSNAGRMSVDSTIPEHVDPQMLADRLRYSVPHAQIGVNVSHRYNIPNNLEDEL